VVQWEREGEGSEGGCTMGVGVGVEGKNAGGLGGGWRTVVEVRGRRPTWRVFFKNWSF